MKTSPAAFMVSLLLSLTNAHAQDSTAVAKADSTTRIAFSHFYDQEQWSSTNFMRTFNDRHALLPSNGVSILNSIRARLPNLAMTSSVNQPMGALRSTTALTQEAGYLVDGVPFDGNLILTNSLNLNTFEFASIAAVSSPNGVALFDLPGAGAFLLKSRDGVGYSKPSFEFNSSATMAWADASSFFSSGTEEKWLTSNSIAYMQDFGEVDTRVSYNLTTAPLKVAPQFGPIVSIGATGDIPFYHSLKINTGFEFDPKLSVRVILDGRFMSQSSSMGSTNVHKSESFLQSNITATYRALDWLDLSMQWVLSRRDSVVGDSYLDSGREWNRSDNRDLWNVFGKIKRKLGDQFYVSGLAGFQLTRMKEDLLRNYYSGSFQSQNERGTLIGSQSAIAGVDVFYRRLLNASVQYREILYDSVRSGSQSRATFSTGLAFNFSELLQSRHLGLGRVRASYGERNPARFASYPHTTFSLPADSYLVRNLEVGVDAGLPNSTLELSLNYFSARSNSSTTYNYGYAEVTLFAETIDDGWEALLQINPKVTGRFRNRSTLMFSTFKALRIPELIESSMIVRTGLYNESRWKGFLLSFLLEHYTVTGPAETGSLRIRDLTLGFDTGSGLSDPGKLSIFITGRNFVDFFTNDDDERRVPLNKSVSFGFTFKI